MFFFLAFASTVLGGFLCWDTTARIPAIVVAVISFWMWGISKNYSRDPTGVPNTVAVISMLTLVGGVIFIAIGAVS